MKSSEQITCGQCGAVNDPSAAACWLCEESLARAADVKYAGPLPPVRFVGPLTDGTADNKAGAMAAGDGTFSLATTFLVITLVAVFCGLLSLGKGLAIPAAILMVPVFIRTVLVVHQRRQLGLDVGPARKAALFVGSFATAATMMVVVGVASLGTFCSVCIGVAAASGARVATAAVFLAAVATLGVVALLVLLFGKWSVARWRRDTSND